MHWFWRVAIAVIVSVLVSSVIGFVQFIFTLPPGLNIPSPLAFYLNTLFTSWWNLPVGLLLCALPIALYVALTKRYAAPPLDNETRCRKCGYILRGITEPRCPECGEPI